MQVCRSMHDEVLLSTESAVSRGPIFILFLFINADCMYNFVPVRY
jgi:hypothetical protein